MAGRQMIRRCLSTSSFAMQMVKPPVAVFGTEGRYATALFSAASKKNSLEAVEKDLNGFAAQLNKDVRLKEFLFDPSVKKTLKADGLAAACDKMNMNALSKNLFLAMAENGRYSEFSSVVNAFGTIMAAHRGEVVCKVTTAKALEANTKKEVESAINGFLKSGEKSLVSYEVDPSIVGGMVVSIGDKFADMSILTKLNRYENIIRAA